MNIVGLNYFYDPDLTTPEALLARYETLTGWAEGVVASPTPQRLTPPSVRAVNDPSGRRSANRPADGEALQDSPPSLVRNERQGKGTRGGLGQPEYPNTRTPERLNTRTPEYPNTRTPEHPNTRTPEYLEGVAGRERLGVAGYAPTAYCLLPCVTVVQHFGRDAEWEQNGVCYRFVRDETPNRERLHAAVLERRPDIVHANGLQYAAEVARLKRSLGGTPVLLQDHANHPPRHPLRKLSLWWAFRQLDAVTFAAPELAQPWHQSGILPRTTPVLTLMEGSSRFPLRERSEARAETGLRGDPLCLWVGRLNTNKDPLTVLEGFAQALPHLPDGRLAMAYSEETLLPAVRAWLAERPSVAERVTLLGRVAPSDLEALYNSADLFLLGSHHEGSGYAVLEALACGVTPLLTDIPSFRILTGEGKWGGLWPVGEAKALAEGLLYWSSRRTAETPAQVRAWFEAQWSFEAMGRQAVALYQTLLERAGR